MSSKKQSRQQRRQKQRAGKRGLSNSTVFILVIVAALLAIGVGAVLLGDGGSPEPGQVWSVEHGHWH